VDPKSLWALNLRGNCEKMVKTSSDGEEPNKVSPMVKVPDKDEGSK
jgi:hypothetical protein